MPHGLEKTVRRAGLLRALAGDLARLVRLGFHAGTSSLGGFHVLSVVVMTILGAAREAEGDCCENGDG